MLIERVYDPDLAQASYVIGCQAQGIAIVIDPRRDIQPYLDIAEKNALRITAVTETHIHADYLSGARQLAAATGANLYLSAEGGHDWRYRFEHVPLWHGSTIELGNVQIEAIHTPGHTPEHLSFLVTDRAATELPGFLFSGDFLFVGDIGRPDLLDEAAGGEETRVPMARQLFNSLRKTVTALPDYMQIHPGHGAGSACGKTLGAVASSTVGYEKVAAWWADYVVNDDEAGFVQALLQGQPDAPSYFGRMKRINRAGPPLLEAEPFKKLAGAELAEALSAGALLLDTRPREEYAQGHVPGSLHLPAGSSFVTWAGWILDPERDQELILLAADERQARELSDSLTRVGVDGATSYTTSLAGLPLEPVVLVCPRKLPDMQGALLLDMRTRSEFESGHIPGARHLHGGRVLWNLQLLPTDKPIVTHCQGGGRNAVVASVLRARGYKQVFELEGSYEGWLAAQKGRHAAA